MATTDDLLLTCTAVLLYVVYSIAASASLILEILTGGLVRLPATSHPFLIIEGKRVGHAGCKFNRQGAQLELNADEAAALIDAGQAWDNEPLSKPKAHNLPENLEIIVYDDEGRRYKMLVSSGLNIGFCLHHAGNKRKFVYSSAAASGAPHYIITGKYDWFVGFNDVKEEDRLNVYKRIDKDLGVSFLFQVIRAP